MEDGASTGAVQAPYVRSAADPTTPGGRSLPFGSSAGDRLIADVPHRRRSRSGTAGLRQSTAADSAPSRRRHDHRFRRPPGRQPTLSRHRAAWPGLNASLAEADPEVAEQIARELRRQQDTLEMIASENFAPVAAHAGAGQRADQQVRRGLPGPPLLRRLRVRRRHRDAGHRADQGPVRRRLRQRPAALRRAGQRRRHAGADQAGRHHPRPVAGARRAPHPRHADQLLRPALQRRRLRGVARRTTGSTWTRWPGWPGSTARS